MFLNPSKWKFQMYGSTTLLLSSAVIHFANSLIAGKYAQTYISLIEIMHIK